MSSNQVPAPGPWGGRPPGRRGRGGKREAILDAATERFGRDGYEHTRWADVAADVGVGPTALYHYFESKQHCLYVIIDGAIRDFHGRFTGLTEAAPDPRQALAAVLEDCFDLSERDILRNRVLVVEQGLLARERPAPREEQARQAARARARELEVAWSDFLAGAMQQGALPPADPRLLTRAILGLYNSVWQWYRPNGVHALRPVAEFFKERALATLGLDAGDLIRPRMLA